MVKSTFLTLNHILDALLSDLGINHDLFKNIFDCEKEQLIALKNAWNTISKSKLKAKDIWPAKKPREIA